VVSKDRHGLYTTTVHLSGPIGDYYASEEGTQTAIEGIDAMKNELQRQVRQETEKKIDLSRRRARSTKKAITIDDKARF
jgi:hypothetical protein